MVITKHAHIFLSRCSRCASDVRKLEKMVWAYAVNCSAMQTRHPPLSDNWEAIYAWNDKGGDIYRHVTTMEMSQEGWFCRFDRTLVTWACVRDDAKMNMKVIRSICYLYCFSAGLIQSIGTQRAIWMTRHGMGVLNSGEIFDNRPNKVVWGERRKDRNRHYTTKKGRRSPTADPVCPYVFFSRSVNAFMRIRATFIGPTQNLTDRSLG